MDKMARVSVRMASACVCIRIRLHRHDFSASHYELFFAGGSGAHASSWHCTSYCAVIGAKRANYGLYVILCGFAQLARPNAMAFTTPFAKTSQTSHGFWVKRRLSWTVRARTCGPQHDPQMVIAHVHVSECACRNHTKNQVFIALSLVRFVIRLSQMVCIACIVIDIVD